MSTNIPYFEDADSALQPGIPTVERKAINAIVYNPVDGTVLCLDWQKYGWKTFIIGGVEGDEDPAVAALREIKEETGYRNLILIANLGETRSAYFAAHKHENRISNATCFLFQLENEEKDEVPETENDLHIPVWLPRNEVAAFLTPSSQKHIWEQAQAYLPSIS